MYIIMWPLTLNHSLGYPIGQLNTQQVIETESQAVPMADEQHANSYPFQNRKPWEHFHVNACIMAKT